MKKIITIMTAAAVLLSAILFTSCGVAEAIKDTVESSYHKWYKYKSSSQINIPVLSASESDEDTTAESTQTLKNAEIYFYFNPDSGLTVAVQSTSSQDVDMLNGLISQRVDFVIGSKKSFALNDFGKVKWTALWSSGKIEKASAPKVVTNPDECILLDGTNQPKIQWRKFLANYLLNKLLDD